MWVVVLFAAAAGLGGGTWRTIQAHPGGTDDEGCHHCRSNCDRWELREDEYHCHDSDGDEEESETTESDDGGETASDDEEVSLEEGERAPVVEVLDGDTLVVSVDGDRVRIRLLGIDCPESSENPKCRRQGRQGGPTCAEQIPEGREATERARELVEGEEVWLESGEEDGKFERGGYDRVLAYIRTANGRDLGRVLIKEGHCYDYGDKYPHPRHEAYSRAEARASENGAGQESSE